MTTRQATLNDLKSLIELFDAYRVFYQKTSDKTGAATFLSERILNQESVIFVSENNEGKLIGFVQLYPIFSSTRMSKLWLLNDLFVDPTQRGKGISKSLINASKQSCINTNSAGMILETAKTNLIGNNLYLSTNFELDQEHNYYSWDV